MDYEYSIKTLQADVAHLQEMRKLHGGRLDVLHDLADKALQLSVANTEAIARLSTQVTTLVAAMLRQYPNGKA